MAIRMEQIPLNLGDTTESGGRSLKAEEQNTQALKMPGEQRASASVSSPSTPLHPMEQATLHLDEAGEAEITLERLSTQSLEEEYHRAIGVNPNLRFLDVTEEERRALLIEGIQDPEAGKERLRQIDSKSDREEKERHWSNI